MRRTCELSPLVWRAVALSLALAAAPSPATAQQDLAKAAQNPVAAMISVPFQSNTKFVFGPETVASGASAAAGAPVGVPKVQWPVPAARASIGS